MTSTARRRRGLKSRVAAAPRPRRPLPNTRLTNLLYLAKIVLAVPLLPFWPIFLSAGAKDAYYVNHYFVTIWHSLRTLVNAFKNRSWGRIFKYNLLVAPRTIEERLGSRLGACTRCAKCCKMLQCDYLAHDRLTGGYFCSVYNTPYWVFGACGRFPIDQADIDAYNCPGFAFPGSVEKARPAAQGALIRIGKL